MFFSTLLSLIHKGYSVSIRKIDLNLFHVFEAVMQHRSVSEAGRQLGVTASAISHALSRLRLALDDDLFVPGDGGMQPTPRALELAPSIRDGLDRIATAIDAKAFEPDVSSRTFRIAASENISVTILPYLVKRIAQVAPGIDLRIFPSNRLDVVRELDDGRLDLALGWFSDLPERMRRRTVVTEAEAIVVRAGHPLTKGPVTMDRLFAFPHVVVEFSGSEEEPVDGFLQDRGVSRRIWIERLLLEMSDDDRGLIGRAAVSVPYFSAVPPLLRGTDMVATLPRRLALQAAERGGFTVLDLPYDPLVVDIEVIWHQRTDRDPGTRWLIGELADVMAAVEE